MAANKKIPKGTAKSSKSLEKYALISVFDKSGIIDFAKIISLLGYKIISTGGTAKVLIDAGLKVIPIQEITGNPESFDGRMKTISFQIEGGILFDRRNRKHIKEAKKLKIKNIEIVVCNLYPFEQTIANPKVKVGDAIESIDVGGPTMIRAAAKNFKNVLVIVDPKDYESLSTLLHSSILLTNRLRQKLAAKAFRHLSFYDSQISIYLEPNKNKFPQEIAIPGRKKIDLRYGDNPHQKSAVYIEPNTNSPLANLEKVTGRDLSATNFTDIFSGLESVRIFKEPCAVVIKHNSPSGIALGSSTSQALERAVEADPQSAFGGVIVLNKPIDFKTAKTFAAFKEESGVLIDIIAAPAIEDKASEFIKNVRKSTGIYIFGKIPGKRSNKKHLRFFDGGFVMQDWDDRFNSLNWKVAGKFKPTKKQLEQMKIAWKFIGRIRSNTIIIVDKDLPMTRGIGSGQTSRVRATKIALEQAGKLARHAILASDSFFPFADSVKLAAKAGIGAIIQQGGSVNDQASIDMANKAKIPMVFTGQRKFWH
ncbi:MAG: bifunctional phosphoribosylaminoimidazolecarboxamide formyltransferase/IMP cyclohydrolase [Candidatus Levybacteria bacterium]|nr:bifunctional phosphoribosylaminoimidazolecarboxamide formyltransferase/IMP cyclohydrolase [Candidatus Levybacteria bacterium]